MLHVGCRPSHVKAQKTLGEKWARTVNTQKLLFLQSWGEFGLLLAYDIHICDASPKRRAKGINREGGIKSPSEHGGEIFPRQGGAMSALSRRPLTAALSETRAG